MFRKMILIAAALALSSTASADLREDWQAIADAIASTGNEMAATKIEEAVNNLSDDVLERVYGNADLKTLADNFRISGKALDATDQALGEDISLKAMIARSAGLPDATGQPSTFLCPFSPDRSDGDAMLIAVDAIQIARIALESAKVIWSGLSRACDETIVILGEGGNAALACIPADVVLFAAELVVGTAEGVVENLGFCDSEVDSAEIEGSYERLGHIHTDLSTHDIDIKAQVETHDTEIKSQLATHDADIKALLADIQGTVDENQRLIKISMSRQLEIMRLLITPQGQREINANVLSCVGDDCPQVPEVIDCKGGSLDWPCK